MLIALNKEYDGLALIHFVKLVVMIQAGFLLIEPMHFQWIVQAHRFPVKRHNRMVLIFL